MYIYIYMYMYKREPVKPVGCPDGARSKGVGVRLGKGQMGSALMGSLHLFMCFLTEGLFGHSR